MYFYSHEPCFYSKNHCRLLWHIVTNIIFALKSGHKLPFCQTTKTTELDAQAVQRQGRHSTDSSAHLFPAVGSCTHCRTLLPSCGQTQAQTHLLSPHLQKQSPVEINQLGQPAQEAVSKLCFAHFVQFVHPDTPP